MQEKTCRRCQKCLPVDGNFCKDKSQPDGYIRFCKECRRNLKRINYARHPEVKREADRRYHLRHQAERCEKGRVYRSENKEQIKAYFTERYATDPEYAEKKKAATKEWREANPERCKRNRRAYKSKHRRRMHLKGKFGLTLEQYDQMVSAQDGLCAICLRPPTGKYPDKLGVDHNHNTGKVRQLLCRDCNSALGLFQDSEELLKKAAEYLARHA